MSTKTKYAAPLILLFGALVFSCVRESIPGITQKLDPSFTLSEAKSYFREHIGSIVPVNFSAEHCCDDPTHNHDHLSTKAETGKTYTPDWGKAVQQSTEHSVVFHVPVKEQSTITAFLVHKQAGKETHKEAQVVITLVMSKLKSGEIQSFVSTVIGEDANKSKKQESAFYYTGNRSGFSGFVIASDLEGKNLLAMSYENGKRSPVIFGSTISDPKLKDREEYDGYKLMQTPLKTKSGNCNKCGQPLGSNTNLCWQCEATELETCVVIGQGGGGNDLEHNCPVCHKSIYPLDLCTCGGGSTPGGGDPGGGGGQPPLQQPEFSIEGPSQLTLGDSYGLGISYEPSSPTVPSNSIQFMISETGQSAFTQLTATHALRPGVYNIYAACEWNDQTITSTNTLKVSVYYPDVHEIMSAMTAQMDACWVKTLNAASTNGRREYGFWIYCNTTTSPPSYTEGMEEAGPIVQCGTTAYINFGFSVGSGHVNLGGQYGVALFHTHTPYTYCDPVQDYRAVGLSDTDMPNANATQVPWIIYDYEAISYDDFSGIKGKHDLYAPARLYTTGPYRRAL